MIVRKATRAPSVLLRGAESLPERIFLHRCELAGLPKPQLQFRAVPGRRWRWDAAWPEYRLLVEVQGGVYVSGRHTRGAGYEGDLRKLNAAQVLGYRVLAFTPGMIESGEAIEVMRQVLQEPADD